MTVKQPLIAGFTLLMMASSCSVERQVFSNGAEIEWQAKRSRSPVLDRSAADRNAHPFEEIPVEAVHAMEPRPVEAPQSQALSMNVEAAEVLALRSQARVTQKKYGMSAAVVEVDQPTLQPAPDLSTAPNYYEDTADEGNKALKTGGWVALGVGFVLLLFVSILIGALLMIGGLAMVLAGAPKRSAPPRERPSQEKEKNVEWQDVVYLNNGSVIRGMLIEQVPNVSLKIQTGDGSIFVYEMKDVQKITKEQKVQ